MDQTHLELHVGEKNQGHAFGNKGLSFLLHQLYFTGCFQNISPRLIDCYMLESFKDLPSLRK